MKVFITGARGYIGAHVVKALKNSGHTVIAADLPGVESNDISEYTDIYIDWDINGMISKKTLIYQNLDAVIHMAALVSVEESISIPSAYYRTNLFGTLNVLDAFPGDKFIFASTGAAFSPTSPYALSKVAAEEIIKEKSSAYTIFRFYNVAGSTGFRSYNEPTHLIRRAAMAARGDISEMEIYGTDYDTKDGTCIRDYVHVEDIAGAVCRAVENPAAMTDYECLGSGKEYSVREVINTMKQVSGKNFKVIEQPRRAGDPMAVKVPSLSAFISPSHTLFDMCEEALKYM